MEKEIAELVLKHTIKRNKMLNRLYESESKERIENLALSALEIAPNLYKREDSEKPFSYDIEMALKKENINAEIYEMAKKAYENMMILAGY